MGKPNYRVVVTFDPQRSVFSARTPELEHISGEAPSRKDAIQRLEEEIDAQLANMLSLGTTPPRAVDETEFSGEVHAKISRGLHRDIAYLARSEGVEVDQIVSELLAAAIAVRQGGRSNMRPQRNANGELPEDIGNRIDSHRGDGNRSDGSRADGNRRGGAVGRGPNSAIMDDRANFIEYVRGLDSAPSGQPPRHGGQGGGHGRNNNNDGRGGRGGRRRGPGGPGQGGGNGQQGRDGNRHGGQHERGPGQGQHQNHQGQRGNQGGQAQGQPAASHSAPQNSNHGGASSGGAANAGGDSGTE